MNYIAEVLHFQNFNRNLNLSAGQIALWHALFAASNRQGLGQPFSVSDQMLQTDSGLGQSGLKKAREVLCQKGLLQYRKPSGRRGDKGVYQMVSLESKGKALVEKNTLSICKHPQQQNEESTGSMSDKSDPNSNPKSNPNRYPKSEGNRVGNSTPLYKDKNKTNQYKQNNRGGSSPSEQEELIRLEQLLANKNLRYLNNG